MSKINKSLSKLVSCMNTFSNSANDDNTAACDTMYFGHYMHTCLKDTFV